MVCTLCAGKLHTLLHSDLHIAFTLEHNSLGCLILFHERSLRSVAVQEHYITVTNTSTVCGSSVCSNYNYTVTTADTEY